MTTYRGIDGFLSIGGRIDGQQYAGAAWASGQGMGGGGAVNFYNPTGTGTGIVVVGDVFTVAGETGSPSHTVVTGVAGTLFFLSAGSNRFTGVQFTPTIATGGTASGATLTFTSNAVVEARAHTVETRIQILNDSVFGDVWDTNQAGSASWDGTGEAWFDYGDANQAELLDTLLTATPTGLVPAVLFGQSAGNQWYAAAALSGARVNAVRGELVQIAYSFSGNGSILPKWG